MDKELIELFEVAKKAADAASMDNGSEYSPEEERCLDALKRLRKFPVNYQVLVSTQVGKRLRHMTKHPRRKIQASASELVEIWKYVIMKETMKNKEIGRRDDKHSVEAEPSGAESAKAKKLQKLNSFEKVPKVETVKVEKIDRSSTLNSTTVINSETISFKEKVENVDVVKIEKNTDGERVKVEKITTKLENRTYDGRKPEPSPVGPPKLTSVIYCKDALRDKIRELLSEALCKVSGEVDEELRDEVNACDPYRVAVLVETAMFEKWGRSNGVQKFKYRSIMYNAKDPNNPDFRRKVLLGYFKPEMVPELTPEDMASDQRQQQNEKIKERALFDCERGAAPKATTDQFKCGRCGKRECTYYQLQTRSADEPMTTFVTCVNCNNHWKFC